jgi:hypothetical protein
MPFAEWQVRGHDTHSRLARWPEADELVARTEAVLSHVWPRT